MNKWTVYSLVDTYMLIVQKIAFSNKNFSINKFPVNESADISL